MKPGDRVLVNGIPCKLVVESVRAQLPPTPPRCEWCALLLGVSLVEIDYTTGEATCTTCGRRVSP